MIKQTDGRLDPYIQKYGCYFLSLAYSVGKAFSPDELNVMWNKCISLHYISGDLNNDGDKDDANEAIIINPNGVCKVLGAKLIYVDRKFPAILDVPTDHYAIGCFYNPYTRYRHFVVINEQKQVIFDPIPNSNTVAKGYLESMRIYKKY